MSLRQLAYFVAVAQELHFARAASRLYVAAPSLSQQIAALERSLGVRLFERHSRKVELTEAGRALLPRAEQLLSDADRLRRDAAAHHAGEARRRLVVGLRPGGFGALTGPLLSAIRAALRDLELAPRLLHYDGLATALADGSIDVLLTLRSAADDDAADFDPLYADHVVAAVPAGGDLARGGTLAAGDLQLEPLASGDVVPARVHRGPRRPRPVADGPTSLEELLLRVALGDEAFALEAGAVARVPDGVALVELEGISPVVAGLQVRGDDDRPLVAEVRAAARAAVPWLLDLLPSGQAPVPERASMPALIPVSGPGVRGGSTPRIEIS